MERLDCPFEVRLPGPADFAGLYPPQWGNALKCGFRPAWAEMTARELVHVQALNRR